jgi:polysaccharide biosynthesis protein PslH
MRVLFLSHRIPFPPNKGDKIRSFNILTHLLRHHEVHVACLLDNAADVAFIPKLRERVRSLEFERIGRKLRMMLAGVRALLTSRAVTVEYFHSAALQAKVDRLLEEVPFDCLFCCSSPMAEYLFRSAHADKVARALRVMDLIDVDSFKWRQYADRSPFWKAWPYRLESARLAAYEQRVAREFDRVYLVSEQECGYFPGGAVVANLRALSNGVDLDFFNPRHSVRAVSGDFVLVFTGVLDYWPNVEGVTWFVERILPLVQQAAPEAQLLLVGSRPTSQVQRLSAAKGVTVTGFVDDTRDYLAAAGVCVVPLRIARGIQNKVLEAMAMGKPVVTTAQTFEGIRAVRDVEIVVADGEAEFAEAVVALLRDSARARQIGVRARACVERHYTWEANLAPLSEIGL